MGSCCRNPKPLLMPSVDPFLPVALLLQHSPSLSEDLGVFHSRAAPGISPGISWCRLSTSSPRFSILNCTITAGWKRQIFYVVSGGETGNYGSFEGGQGHGSELGFPPWHLWDVPSRGAGRVVLMENTQKIPVGHSNCAQLLLAHRHLQTFTSAVVPIRSL